MSLNKYKTAKKLEVASKFGEIALIVLLIIKVADNATQDDLSYLTGVFLLAIIVLIANIIQAIAERKALKEIEEALGKNGN